MSNRMAALPAILAHSDDDTPIPTWEQVTRSECSINTEMSAQVSRIIGKTGSEMPAVEVWNSWPGNVKRSVALLDRQDLPRRLA